MDALLIAAQKAREDVSPSQREAARHLGFHRRPTAKPTTGARLDAVEFVALAYAPGVDPLDLLAAYLTELGA